MLDLTPAEFQTLKTLSHEPGKVFSREQLLNHLYDDYRVVTDRTIDSHIKNLRRKLESLDAEQSFIRAVYGVGYRWEADACRIVVNTPSCRTPRLRGVLFILALQISLILFVALSSITV